MVMTAVAASSQRAALVLMVFCHSARSSRVNGIGRNWAKPVGSACMVVVMGSPPGYVPGADVCGGAGQREEQVFQAGVIRQQVGEGSGRDDPAGADDYPVVCRGLHLAH